MNADRVERRLTAILAADVAGYSRLMGADEEGTLAELKAHRRELIDPKIKEHHGRIVKTTGDGALVEFASVVDAVRCAVEIQRGMTERNATVPQEKRVEFRIGVNVGDIIIDEGDIFGDGVNVAARLESLAEPGGICVSSRVQEDIEGKLDFAFEDAGEQHFKNIARSIRVYHVQLSGAAALPSIAVALPEKPSIAVLPFQNLSADPEQEYFADGMVEDIITGLSRFGWLFVIARNSSFTYKGKIVDVKQVGRELGVRYVLEGSIRKAANRVRITAQLIDAASGAHVWADRFEGGLEDVFELQDQVTASVVGIIEPRLQRAEIERAGRKPTESLDAYDCYLRGMASFYLLNPDSLSEARRLFECAIKLDPKYASPYGMAAWTVHLRKTNGWMTDPIRETADGIGLARRAAVLGREDPIALWSSGFCLAYLAGEVEVGAAHVDRAIVLNPNSAAAWSVSGWLRIYLGEPLSAIERFERALRLSPLDAFTYFGCAGMAFAYVYAGRFEEAASWATKACHEQPNWGASWRAAAMAYAFSGRMPEAREAINRLLELYPSLRLSNLANVASPFRRAEDLARYTEGLRIAGLPE